jgi:hypothetical protein
MLTLRTSAERNWFPLACSVGGVFGAIECALRWMVILRGAAPDIEDWLFALRGVAGHTALALSCVYVASLLGGRFWAWLLGLIVATSIHLFNNLFLSLTPADYRAAIGVFWPSVSAGFFVLIILVAFNHFRRRRVDPV